MRSVTGFPGFLGSALVERLLARTDDRIVRLVQERYRELDCRRTPWLLKPAAADGEANGVRDRIELVTGDITEPDLGLGPDGVHEREYSPNPRRGRDDAALRDLRRRPRRICPRTPEVDARAMV